LPSALHLEVLWDSTWSTCIV